MTNSTVLMQLSDVYVPSVRQRGARPDRHIEELRSSIEREGLIHAIVVTTEGQLIVGYCRHQAIQGMVSAYRYGDQEVPVGYIPALKVSNLDDDAIFRLELEENLRRKNLTPMEEAKAVAELHRRMQSEHGSSWSRNDTGKKLDELRGSPRLTANPEDWLGDEVGEAILLEGFKDDPDIAKAASRPEAIRKAKKKLEHLFTSTLGVAWRARSRT